MEITDYLYHIQVTREDMAFHEYRTSLSHWDIH